MSKALTVLKGVKAFVEAYTDDGINCSDSFGKELEALGADVEESFGEHCTHLIWNNGKSKRLKAALAMDILAVSPLWIEQCKQSKKQVFEGDFAAISNETINPVREASSSKVAPVPVQARANQLRSLDSPSLSSSQREETASKKTRTKGQPLKKKSTTTNVQGDVKSLDSIPLPSFKKTKLVSELMQSKPTNNIRRRSERISELEPDDENELDPDSSSDDESEMDVDSKSIRQTNTKSNASLPTAANQPTSVPDDMLDIPCTPYETDPSAIAVVRVDLLPSSGPKVSLSKAKLQEVKGRVSRKVASKQSDIDVEEISKQSDSIEDCPTSDPDGKGSKKNIKLPVEVPSKSVLKPSGRKSNTRQEKMVSSRPVASTEPPQAQPALRIAVTGFDAATGDLDSMINTVQDLIKSLEGWYASSSKSHSTDTISKVLVSSSDEPDAHCTHVVTSSAKKSRSLRILFALARGVPIVTEEWVYACMCASKWENPRPYRVPIYAHAPLGSPQKLFEGICFMVVVCKNPSKSIVEKLLTVLGASLTDSLMTATCLLFGAADEALGWIKHVSAASDISLRSEYLRAVKLSSKKRTVTFKYVCDCIENCKLLTPSGDHILSVTEATAVPHADKVVPPVTDSKTATMFFDSIVNPGSPSRETNTARVSKENSALNSIENSKASGKKRPLVSSTDGPGDISILPNATFSSPIVQPDQQVQILQNKRRVSSSSSKQIPSSGVDRSSVGEKLNLAHSDASHSDFYSLHCSDDEVWSEDDRFKSVRPASVRSSTKSSKLLQS